ncbi:hypothetical protein KL912_000585 [Ogataea haglerorum]|nr:hypothetical protein KL912_000585 [Ogataea haglerorum]
MPPLASSASKCYWVEMPNEHDTNPANRLDVRTGASTDIYRSRILVYSGSLLPLTLKAGFSLQDVESEFEAAVASETDPHIDHNEYLSPEVFSLNLLNRKWIHLPAKNKLERPRPRMFHSMIVHDNYLYVYGGLCFDQHNKLKTLNDVWRFDRFDKSWKCLLPDGNSVVLRRFDHMSMFVPELHVVERPTHHGLLFFGGVSDEAHEIIVSHIYDLVSEQWFPNLVFRVQEDESSEKIKYSARDGPEVEVPGLRSLGLRSSLNSAIPAQALDSTQQVPPIYLYHKQPDQKHEPFITFPIGEGVAGTVMSLTSTNSTKVVPFELDYPTVGYFGENLIVTGFRPGESSISLFIFNRVSRTWMRLQISCTHSARSHRFFKGFVWNSHHKVVFLGNGKTTVTPPSVQYFSHFNAVSLPFTNTYGIEMEKAFSNAPETAPQHLPSSLPLDKSENTSFAAYSHYVAPQIMTNSIRSVFPPYAVALGKNAFERSTSIADFEFICADGTSIPVPLNLCRKRWGSRFDKLLADAYARAFADRHALSEVTEPSSLDSSSAETEFLGSLRSSKTPESRAPLFRLPFSESGKSSPLSGTPRFGSLPPSRRSSLAASRRDSGASRRNSLLGYEKLSMSAKNSNLRRSSGISSSSSSSAFSSSNRDVSEASDHLLGSPLILEELPPQPPMPEVPQDTSESTPSFHFHSPSFGPKDASTSRLTQALSGVEDVDPLSNTSLSDRPREESVDFPDAAEAKMDARFLPRTLCLPFSKATVRAFSEFLYTGQLGSNWKVVPTCVELLMIAHLYEVPLLYDLISEALFVVIARKEAALVVQAKSCHPVDGEGTGIAAIDKFTEQLAALDDNLMDLTLLKRASKAIGRYSNSGSLASSEVHFRDSFHSASKIRSHDMAPNDSSSSNSSSDSARETFGLLNEQHYKDLESHVERPATETKEWPTLKALMNPDAPACSDQIIDILVESGTLASDIKLMLRAINTREMIAQLKKHKRDSHDLKELSERLKAASVEPPKAHAGSTSSLPETAVYKTKSESELASSEAGGTAERPRIPHVLTFTNLERAMTNTSEETNSPRRKRGFGLFKKNTAKY